MRWNSCTSQLYFVCYRYENSYPAGLVNFSLLLHLFPYALGVNHGPRRKLLEYPYLKRPNQRTALRCFIKVPIPL
jgi:hypothetical protein